MMNESSVYKKSAVIAEYLALASHLRLDSPEADYRRANSLSLQLAMWLDEKLYKQIVLSIVNPTPNCNPGTVAISIRKAFLLENAGSLNESDIACHAPGIGNPKK